MDGYVRDLSLAELLADPSLRLILQADGCDMAQLVEILKNAADTADASSGRAWNNHFISSASTRAGAARSADR